jgi:small subunit ribosomal protein S18
LSEERNNNGEERDERPRRSSQQRGGGSGRPRRRRYGRRRPRISPLYNDENFVITYKQPETLRRFVTEHGKIRPRRQTGLYTKDQRKLAREVKRARHLALLPFTPEHTHNR